MLRVLVSFIVALFALMVIGVLLSMIGCERAWVIVNDIDITEEKACEPVVVTEQIIQHEVIIKYFDREIEVPKPVEIIIKVPIEVEKIVEVPVEVIREIVVEVEKIVEVPVEVVRFVEKVIEVEVPIPVETIVEVEKIVEVKVAVDRIVEVEKVVDRIIYVDQIVEVPVEVIKKVEVEVEKIVEVPVEVVRVVNVPFNGRIRIPHRDQNCTSSCHAIIENGQFKHIELGVDDDNDGVIDRVIISEGA